MNQPPLFHVSRGTDSYKFCHHDQYPPGTSHVYSYFEARRAPRYAVDEIVAFGLQYFLKRYLTGSVVNFEQIELSSRMAAAHFGNPGLFNRKGWLHILQKHNGYLPVVIRAVPEGMVVPAHNVLMTVENTDPECHWLTNWLETLLVQTWYMGTVATNSRACKRIILDALEQSGDPALLPFKLHDFGFRGVTCPEAAATAGAAHLVNFKGTDTFIALDMIERYYPGGDAMPGFSIPASEHSTITSWGQNGERDAFANMLARYPEGLVACVSDSYDIWRACRDYWGGELKAQVLGRNGTLVVRPDSGQPADTVVRVLNTLGDAFGYERNAKGFKVLPPQVRVIQGDGINRESLALVLDALLDRQWSADNVAFGSGGGLLQKFDRDTLSYAFKCSSVRVNGSDRDVFKSPIGDSHKRSRGGRLKLVRDSDGDLMTVQHDAVGEDLLVEVFRDGHLRHTSTFNEVRKRAELEELQPESAAAE